MGQQKAHKGNAHKALVITALQTIKNQELSIHGGYVVTNIIDMDTGGKNGDFLIVLSNEESEHSLPVFVRRRREKRSLASKAVVSVEDKEPHEIKAQIQASLRRGLLALIRKHNKIIHWGRVKKNKEFRKNGSKAVKSLVPAKRLDDLLSTIRQENRSAIGLGFQNTVWNFQNISSR